MKVQSRVYGLDILRAFAILFVIYSHSFFLIIDHINERAYNIFSLDGVTLFFVLSGYLIGGILLKTIHQTRFNFNDLKQFWIRRWFRTLPNYFFMLLLLIALFRWTHGFFPDNMAAYFCFLQNFSYPHPSFFPEAWSLSVEEWFYLLIPAGLFLSIRYLKLSRKWVTFTWTVSILLLITGFRIYRSIKFGYADFESWDNFQRKVVLTRLDSIMFGFLGAWIVCYYRSIWIRIKRHALMVGILLLFVPAALESLLGRNMAYTNYLSLTITSLGTLLLLPALSELKTGKGLVYRFLTFVSIISYSMYLVNFSLIQLSIIPSLTGMIVRITSNHLEISIIRYVTYWMLTFLLAYLLYSFYEKPMMAMRERFGKKRAEGLEPVK